MEGAVYPLTWVISTRHLRSLRIVLDLLAIKLAESLVHLSCILLFEKYRGELRLSEEQWHARLLNSTLIIMTPQGVGADSIKYFRNDIESLIIRATSQLNSHQDVGDIALTMSLLHLDSVFRLVGVRFDASLFGCKPI